MYLRYSYTNYYYYNNSEFKLQTSIGNIYIYIYIYIRQFLIKITISRVFHINSHILSYLQVILFKNQFINQSS